MPFIQCYTNLSRDKLPENFVEWLSELGSQVLEKGIERFVTTVIPDMMMMRHGTTDPAMFIQIHSIGSFDAERNPSYTDKLLEAIAEKVNLPAKRVVLHYFPVEKMMVGMRPL
ncbi:macrophage migration inhibitory factor-like [Argopecten irradians]|uniref:macrophage migration inhibitory factor-like n=1 Tax=Argopecten irradians TaxID=31199 RepID=UPI0037153C26